MLSVVRSAPTSADAPSMSSCFGRDVISGLSARRKSIPCKYFYDQNGSRLFDEIGQLPEYYQTRTEMRLLATHAGEIASLIGPNAEIIEFGAGSLQKVRILLTALSDPLVYTPIDISGDYLLQVASEFATEYPALALRPFVADFTQSLTLPRVPGVAKRVGFFPGSTIANFESHAAVALLKEMRGLLVGGGLLVGADLVKDPRRLHAAYNDARGVTAAFNKNLLSRANRELHARFNLEGFSHYAPYNLNRHRVEMYLVSLRRQSVRIGTHCFHFEEGEPVHTEDSQKYTVAEFRELAAQAGFTPRAVWCDEEMSFSLHWLES